jgi:V/A-type H+-transporting ATPase subunit I
MKYVNIMGGMNDIDRVIENYISNYEIQLEYTLKEVVNTSRLEPCYEQNPYSKYLEKAEKFANIIGMEKDHAAKSMEKEAALEILNKVSEFF